MTHDQAAPEQHVPAVPPPSGTDTSTDTRTGTGALLPTRTPDGAGGPLGAQRLTVGAIRYSGLVGIAVLVVAFSLYLPGLFFSEITLRTIISNQAITGILALGALIPLVAGQIDLSFGSVAGLSLVLTVYLSINSEQPLLVIILIAMLASTACGLVSGLLVALVRLDSFIVTLGMSSLVLGISTYVTGGTTMYGVFDQRFSRLGQGTIGPIPYLTLILVGLGIVVWIWLEHTAAGRYTMAVGSNPVAARLAGHSVVRTQILTLTASSVIAGAAGVLLAAQVGNGSTTTGPGYLLPVIAALFLGATQVREGANVVGTLIAIFLLGTGIKGLQLAGASNWTTDVFNGGVLLVAITAAALRSRRSSVGG